MFRVAGAVLLGLTVAASAYAGDASTKLMEGNKRFVSGEPAKKDIGQGRRAELVKGQHPFATVLTCSDSRVSPELLYDQGLGDVFVVRVAGNVADSIALGSIEYGVEHLHTPVLVILGHQSCGAVAATMDAEGEPEGNIGAILKKIQPAVAAARASGKADKAEMLNYAVQQNVRNVLDYVMENSPIVRELVHEGKLEVVTAEYYLDSGEVRLVEGGKPAAHAHGTEGE